MANQEQDDLGGALEDIDPDSPFYQAFLRAQGKPTEEVETAVPPRPAKRERSRPANIPVVRKPIADYRREAAAVEAAQIAAERRVAEIAIVSELSDRARGIGLRFSNWVNTGASNGAELVDMVRDFGPVVEGVRTMQDDNNARGVMTGLIRGLEVNNDLRNPRTQTYIQRFKNDRQYRGVSTAATDRDVFLIVVAFETLSNMSTRERKGFHTFIVDTDKKNPRIRVSIQSVLVNWLRNSPAVPQSRAPQGR